MSYEPELDRIFKYFQAVNKDVSAPFFFFAKVVLGKEEEYWELFFTAPYEPATLKRFKDTNQKKAFATYRLQEKDRSFYRFARDLSDRVERVYLRANRTDSRFLFSCVIDINESETQLFSWRKVDHFDILKEGYSPDNNLCNNVRATLTNRWRKLYQTTQYTLPLSDCCICSKHSNWVEAFSTTCPLYPQD